MVKTNVSAAILTAVLCISGNLLAYSGDGDGSAGNPYQIANVADFRQQRLWFVRLFGDNL